MIFVFNFPCNFRTDSAHNSPSVGATMMGSTKLDWEQLMERASSDDGWPATSFWQDTATGCGR